MDQSVLEKRENGNCTWIPIYHPKKTFIHYVTTIVRKHIALHHARCIVDVTHCLYYVDVPNLVLWNPKMLASLNNKAMESVRKEHMTMFHKRLLVCDLALGPEFFCNKYRFITTWILIHKWWLQSWSCLCLCKWPMNKRFISWSSGTSPWFSGKLKNFPRSSYRMPSLKNGFTRQCFGFSYLARSSWLYIQIFYEIFNWTFLWMVSIVFSLQLEVEAKKFFNNTITNLGVSILESVEV